MNRWLCVFACVLSLHAYSSLEVEKLKREIRRDFFELEGWCSQEKMENFIDLVLEVKPKVCVEIGVFMGQSLHPVAAALQLLKQGKVIAIDPWDKAKCIQYFDSVTEAEDSQYWGEINYDFVYQRYSSMIWEFHLEPYVETIRDTAQGAAAQVGDIDILHIDGNHGAFASLLDVQLYVPKVVPGGYIWLNCASFESHKEAVKLLLEQADIVKRIDDGDCILFRKKN